MLKTIEWTSLETGHLYLMDRTLLSAIGSDSLLLDKAFQ